MSIGYWIGHRAFSRIQFDFESMGIQVPDLGSVGCSVAGILGFNNLGMYQIDHWI
jgi:hypothetical protein